jgi:hypothetical protein
MRSIVLKDAKAGLVLAEPVHTSQGMLLLKRGAVLTARHLWVMKTWGIARIRVEGPSPAPEGANGLAPVNADDVAERLRRRFPVPADDEVMQAVFAAALKCHLRKEADR